MVINFEGKVCGGAGLFAKENKIPSPINELSGLGEWPDTFEPGTFNIQVAASKWPEIHGLDFPSRGVSCLDRSSIFPPALYLDHSNIPNNTLNPNNRGEFGGDLQFWRALIQLEGISENVYCYMLRRVKSGYRDKVELVSNIKIRSTYNLSDGHPVELTIFSGSS